jgi:serine/threonine protein kinase
MGCVPNREVKIQNHSQKYIHSPKECGIDEDILTSSISQRYDFIKLLGQGGVGKTYLCQDKDKCFYAIQKLPKSNMGKENCEILCSHFSTLQKINHPYIVKFYELYEESQCVYVVMEYCNGINLFEKILSMNQHTEKESSEIILMLLHATEYLGKLGIVHCDIKPLNIMYANENKETQIKLIDFNLCKFKSEGKDEVMNGTPQFLAPEILEKIYSTQSDVWAVGVTMHVLLSGEYPYWGESHKELYNRIKEGKLEFDNEVWANVSPDAKDLLKKLLCVDYRKRITAQEAIGHQWFKNAVKYTKNNNAKVSENFAHIYQQYKLYKAMTKIVTITQWKSAFAKVKEVLRTEDGTHKVYLSEKDIIGLLQEMNHSATIDEIKAVLEQYNKHSSFKVRAYDKLAQLETFEGQLHSSSEIEIRNFI